MDPFINLLLISFANVSSIVQQIYITQFKMLYSNSPAQIMQELLNTKQPLKNLQQNDKMLLIWNKNQLIKRWPKCMVPVGQKVSSSDVIFTGMLDNINEKAYEYDKVTKNVQYQFHQKQNSQLLRSKSLKQQDVDNSQKKNNEGEFNIVQQPGDKQIGINQIQQNQGGQPNQKIISKQSVISVKQRLSPFLPNYDNPFDKNVNAKALKHKFQKVHLNSNNRNVAALIQSQKKSDELKQSLKFGRSLPKKSTNNSIDISDILKYTLGIKREQQKGITPPPIKNPFLRVPPKFYDSLGDFYGSK